jgi:hypothetical protein
MINATCDLEIVSDPAELARAGVDKPFLRLKNIVAANGGVSISIELTINLAHMIGGAAAGAAERFGLPW